ncbi:MAG: hypothetical protein IKH33_05245 [Bacteroidales bacterium]|nr:hypothetical protein [Bacteroidales bacterium]MBR6991480.1 hypothetical protein [Bacteroidales bacterium]
MKLYLIIILLVLAVLATIALTGYIYYLLTKRYFDNQQKTQMLQMRIDEHREAVKLVTPIRLQAYERMALYLERISPESLVLRCYQPGMDTKLLQGVMTKTIRDEWEHNLSQQVYISSEAWRRIRQAKDEMMGVINSAAITIPDDADPTRLASAIFATIAEGQVPTASALEFLKQEMREL